MKRKVLIVGSSKLPTPAVKGGAVPTLIEELIHQQEKEKNIDLTCISYHDEDAINISKKYPSTSYIWAKVPNFVSIMDRFLYWVAKNIFRINRLHSLSFLFRVIWFSFFVGNELRKEEYDEVIFENSLLVLTAIKYFGNKKKYEGKYYLHMHSVPRKYYGNEKIVENCKKIICVSEYVAEEMQKDNRLNTTKDNYTVMYNCINDELFKPLSISEKEKIRIKLNITKEKKIILFAGRVCADKGVEEVISAVTQLEGIDYILLIVGSNFYKSKIIGPYEQKLQEMCKPIRDKIMFTGYVDNADMPNYYNIADVVVLPSIWNEPAGMTMVEAMDCGRPLITTISGGIPEYVGNGNCILLERDSNLVKNIKSNIERFFSEEKVANELSRKARNRAAAFNEKYYYEQLLKIIGD
ncbi:glycosyltransferase family 1 protein [Eubacterium sp. AM05-23]|uniref:glycosyltransferase family 4 protein n=1 Tax=Eubacterium TaxID=1730 RepID=UPI000E4F0297|nr:MULTISPECIES: glycosyltransferase family 4 protein [Eubacterium]RHO57205.1 glycosyltransferase family 1 protein [Eubacterium sp. AM05-23]